MAAPARRSDNHDYRQCFHDDPACPRFPCRVYREGRRDGDREGYERGRQDGYVAGYADGYPDGIAACPLPHGNG